MNQIAKIKTSKRTSKRSIRVELKFEPSERSSGLSVKSLYEAALVLDLNTIAFLGVPMSYNLINPRSFGIPSDKQLVALDDGSLVSIVVETDWAVHNTVIVKITEECDATKARAIAGTSKYASAKIRAKPPQSSAHMWRTCIVE